MTGYMDGKLQLWQSGPCYISLNPVPAHAVNHVVFEQVMKLLGMKSVVIHPNKSVVGVLYMLLSLT